MIGPPGDRASEEQQALQWLWESRAIFSLPEVPCKAELTYAMILDYFAKCQALHACIHKSVVLREKLPEGVRIVQVFLERENRAGLYGRYPPLWPEAAGAGP